MLREVHWSVVLLAVVIVFSLSFSGPYLKPVIDIVFTIPYYSKFMLMLMITRVTQFLENQVLHSLNDVAMIICCLIYCLIIINM